MTPQDLRRLFASVREGQVDLEAAVQEVAACLKALPFEDLGFARVDHHREWRQGFPEVVFGPGKTPEQVAAIADRLVQRGQTLLVTRTTAEAFEAVRAAVPDAQCPCRGPRHHRAPAVASGTGLGRDRSSPPPAPPTSPVAEEAALTAEVMGNRVDRLYDVGVAGLHRLLDVQGPPAAARPC